MTTDKHVMIDGNEAAARVAYQLNEVIALFPITPACALRVTAIRVLLSTRCVARRKPRSGSW